MAESMKLTRNPDGYVVQVPDDVVAALGLHEGDPVRVVKSGLVTISATEEERRWALDTIKELAKSNPLPPGYKFDRDEANARRPALSSTPISLFMPSTKMREVLPHRN